VAYYLLVGEDVFRGHSLIEACGKQLHEIPESPSARSGRPLPEALERLVLDCLEKLPERRPQSAREFLQRLAQVSAEAWDASQAEAWWREHGSSVRAASSVPASTSQTIQVDIGAGRIP
jgi:serine/threonine-protein kinase